MRMIPVIQKTITYVGKCDGNFYLCVGPVVCVWRPVQAAPSGPRVICVCLASKCRIQGIAAS